MARISERKPSGQNILTSHMIFIEEITFWNLRLDHYWKQLVSFVGICLLHYICNWVTAFVIIHTLYGYIIFHCYIQCIVYKIYAYYGRTHYEACHNVEIMAYGDKINNSLLLPISLNDILYILTCEFPVNILFE